MNLNIKHLYIFSAIGVYLVFAYSDLISAILPTQYLDTNRLMNELETRSYENNWNSFTATAWLFSKLPVGFSKLAAVFIGVASIYIFLNQLKSSKDLLVGSFLLLAPTLLFMTVPTKDVVVTLLTIIVFYILNSNRPVYKNIALVSFVYAIYAIAIRQYYLLILAVFVILIVFSNCRNNYRAMLVFGLFSILLFLPESVFMALQGSRDSINLYRAGDVGTRSAFFNIYRPDNPFSFIANYLHSVVRLNIPIIFSISFKDIFSFINTTTFLYFLYFGLFRLPKKEQLFSFLILSHVMVITLFEPDLGSYLRHFVSVFLYLGMIISGFHEYRKLQIYKKAND